MELFYWILKYQVVNPKKYKVFKEGLDKEFDVPEEVVDDLINFYYTEVRQALSEFKDININVENLGTFTLKKNKLEKSILKNKNIVNKLKRDDQTVSKKYEAIVEKLEKQTKALDKLLESISKRKQFKENK